MRPGPSLLLKSLILLGCLATIKSQGATCTIPTIEDGQIICGSGAAGINETCDVECYYEGYYPSVQSVTCSLNLYDGKGIWDATPYCQPVLCDGDPFLEIEELSNVLCKAPKASYFSLNIECTFSCNDGYELVGAEVLTCVSDGTDDDGLGEWDNPAPSCESESATCSIPKFTGGQVICAGSEAEIYETCDVECYEGYYQLVESNTCLWDFYNGKVFGKWNETTPYCKAVECVSDPIYESQGMYWVCKSPDVSIVPPFARYSCPLDWDCTFYCPDGYGLVGAEVFSEIGGVITCISDGTDDDGLGEWDNPIPSCEKCPYCPPSGELSQTCISDEFTCNCSCSCNTGYVENLFGVCVEDKSFFFGKIAFDIDDPDPLSEYTEYTVKHYAENLLGNLYTAPNEPQQIEILGYSISQQTRAVVLGYVTYTLQFTEADQINDTVVEDIFKTGIELAISLTVRVLGVEVNVGSSSPVVTTGDDTKDLCMSSSAIQCDAETAACTVPSSSLSTYCQCKEGFYLSPSDYTSCILQVCNDDSNCNRPFGSCNKTEEIFVCNCAWGLDGHNCKDPWLLVAVLSLCFIGLCTLIAIIICVVRCSCKTQKKTKKDNNENKLATYDKKLGEKSFDGKKENKKAGKGYENTTFNRDGDR